MHATATFAAILAFTATALANPLKRDPGNFRLYEHHTYQHQCAAGTCGIGDINSLTVGVHDDCNGGGCGSKTARNLTPRESFCDADIRVCDRTLRLVSRGAGDCKAIRDLSSNNNGQAYATLVEGGTDVGTCQVDFSRSRTCSIAFGGVDMSSNILCKFF